MPFLLATIKFSSDPLINVGGAYFPAWLACMLVGLFGTWFLGILFHRLEYSTLLHPPSLMLPGLFAAITLWTWLLFFAAR